MNPKCGTPGTACDFVWSGDSDIATFDAIGGNHPFATDSLDTDQRHAGLIFDGDSDTYWHGLLPVTEQNSVTVKFTNPVIFHALTFHAGPDEILHQDRYQNACLYLDGIKSDCTETDRVTSAGDKITLKPPTKTEVTTAELRLQEGVAAEIAELKLHYHKIAPIPDPSPCPSKECWNFDDNKCSLKPGCVSLSCGATEMSISILPEVFGTTPGTMVTPNMSEQDVIMDTVPQPGFEFKIVYFMGAMANGKIRFLIN